MLILNTTFAVDKERSHEFLLWLQQELVPKVTHSDLVQGTGLTTVLQMDPDEARAISADSYCLQNAFEDMDSLNEWLGDTYIKGMERMDKRFGISVQAFNTLLSEIPLTPPN